MVKKGAVKIVRVASQLVDTKELARYLSQVSLKDKDITSLKEEQKDMEKANKEYRDKNTKLKDKLRGKSILQLTQRSIWDLIAVEVTKFWGQLKILEERKAYIYSALEKYTRANE